MAKRNFISWFMSIYHISQIYDKKSKMFRLRCMEPKNWVDCMPIQILPNLIGLLRINVIVTISDSIAAGYKSMLNREWVLKS